MSRKLIITIFTFLIFVLVGLILGLSLQKSPPTDTSEPTNTPIDTSEPTNTPIDTSEPTNTPLDRSKKYLVLYYYIEDNDRSTFHLISHNGTKWIIEGDFNTYTPIDTTKGLFLTPLVKYCYNHDNQTTNIINYHIYNNVSFYSHVLENFLKLQTLCCTENHPTECQSDNNQNSAFCDLLEDKNKCEFLRQSTLYMIKNILSQQP